MAEPNEKKTSEPNQEIVEPPAFELRRIPPVTQQQLLSQQPQATTDDRVELLTGAVTRQQQTIEELRRQNRDTSRTNEELRLMLQTLLPAVYGQIETVDTIAGTTEETQAQTRQGNENVRNFERTLYEQIDVLKEQNAIMQRQLTELSEQGKQENTKVRAAVQGVGAAVQGVGAAVEGVGAAVQGVGAAVQGVGENVADVGQNVLKTRAEVREVGKEVALGRRENTFNFDIARKQIVDFREAIKKQIEEFRDLTVANFNDVKRLIREAGKNATDGCIPLDTSTVLNFIKSLFTCIWYFLVFIGKIILIVWPYYKAFRDGILEILFNLAGWAPIPNIDRIIRIIWMSFEAALLITLINRVGVFFGCKAVASWICIGLFDWCKAGVVLLFQTIWYVIKFNPASQTIIDILDGVGFFTWSTWLLSILEGIKDGWLLLVAGVDKIGKFNMWGGVNEVVLHSSPTITARNRYESSLTVTDRQIDEFSIILATYSNNINQIMSYVRGILNGTQDPTLYKYFDTEESKEIGKIIQSRILLIENLVVTGNLKMLSDGQKLDGPTIEEIDGGRTRRRRFKKLSNRKSRSKKTKKSKRLRRKRKKTITRMKF
jgi:uncharacterized protein YoxC